MNGPSATSSKLPKHIAIIMDGNGRWAQKRGFSRTKGHIEGARNLVRLLPFFSELKTRHITVFAFSKENWRRSSEEISGLFTLFQEMIQEHYELFQNYKIRFRWLGQAAGLPSGIVQHIHWLEQKTEQFEDLIFNFAFNYSGQEDILQAVRVLLKKVGTSNPPSLDEASFKSLLSTSGQPDVDMLIRTGGEQRISNFLLWEIAYAELYFTKTLWPAMTDREIWDMILDFCDRERRFGGLMKNKNSVRQEVLNA